MYKLSFIILFFIITSTAFSQSPHGDNLKFDCQDCHSTDTWKIKISKLNFDHSQTGFTLEGQHEVLNCQSCHTDLKFTNTKSNCFDCHENIHQNTVEPNCESCHNTNSWVITNIDEMHNKSRFPLLGAHRLADCQECHTSVNNLMFQVLGVQCINCHQSDFVSAKSPDHIVAGFSKDCEECHRVSDLEWRRANVNHEFFPLVGGHKINNCFDCHAQNTFKGLSQDCITCHQKDYNASTDPSHSENGFSTNCVECHTTNPGWQPATFADHNQFFILDGAHKQIENDCNKCHAVGFANTPDQCYDCHKTNFENTTDPSHQAAGFGTDCETCHNTNAWKPASFDHDNQFFPIYSGAHKGEWNQCSDCHTNSSNFMVFSCITCHEHNQPDTDDHHNGINGYVYESSACYACHPTGNSEDVFNHANTGFTLVGAHASTSCAECHTSGYSNTSPECVNCHQSDYTNAANPNHSQAGVSTKCEDCHNTTSFTPSTFDHSVTGFALTNSHNLPQCSSCHTGSTSNASAECYSCHSSDYNNAPEHVSQNYPQTCQNCHNTTNWDNANFDHNTTNFPLTGSHTTVKCSDCHTSGYAGTPTECNSCHQSDYTNAANPNHSQAGVSTKCEDCHNTTSFTPSTFDHSVTGFALTNSHNLPQCSSCHTGSTSNASAECYSCHSSDYNNAPEHVSQNYPQTCQDCHKTTNWSDANFDHSKTNFPLTGAHTSVNCSDCHTSGYVGTPIQCYSCHQGDYNSTTNPPHASSGFGTTCEDCHNTSNWNDATFDHDGQYFPIYSGKHSTVWNSCATCHTNSSDYSVFSCIDCHEHSKSNTDGHHSDVRDYSYNSAACYNCHPDGRAGDSPNFKINSNKVW